MLFMSKYLLVWVAVEECKCCGPCRILYKGEYMKTLEV